MRRDESHARLVLLISTTPQRWGWGGEAETICLVAANTCYSITRIGIYRNISQHVVVISRHVLTALSLSLSLFPFQIDPKVAFPRRAQPKVSVSPRREGVNVDGDGEGPGSGVA